MPTKGVIIPNTLWDEMQEVVDDRLKLGSLKKPIVFVLYTKEDDHHEVISYREIPTVRVTGDYPNGDYRYTYPGIKALHFYPPKGTGKWFSGTLVIGGGTELDEGDKRWMIRDRMDFRIKKDKNSVGDWSCKVYYIDFPVVPLDLH